MSIGKLRSKAAVRDQSVRVSYPKGLENERASLEGASVRFLFDARTMGPILATLREMQKT